VGSNSIVAQYSGDTALNGAAAIISLSVTPAASGPPSITSVANGASFRSAYAPGMVLTVFGSNLAGAAWAASTVPLPLQQLGVSVTIGGVGAPLYYVSPTQLNVQIPYETPVNQPVTLTVTVNGAAASTTFTASAAAPAVFTDAKGAVTPAATAARGAVISLYLTGAGAVSPAVATGAAPAPGTAVAQLPAPVQSTTVTIGGVSAPVQFVGIPAGLVGVTQINVTVPASAALGSQPVIVTVGTTAGATATLTVTQ
jgi:adhesin/invasin